jgi:restriction endonuclease Mrr
MQCLYTAATEMPGDSPIRWFQFERDVHMLMRALGFDVEHVAASRKADNGVDVYAVKGVDFDETRWIIQCKCWGPKRKVSPSTVRDLIGALTHYPRGTRGMIVTTSGFTSGAKREAETARIRLVDGAEFMELIRRAQYRNPKVN